MIRKHFFLTNDQFRFLRDLEGNVSEHIRRALDLYIDSKKELKISNSPSKYERSDESVTPKG